MLDGEEVSNKCRVFSKIFKLGENNQYGFAVTKPLPIGNFNKEAHVCMDILFNSIENFDSSAKVGEIFVVDIKVSAYDDPRKKIYNEVFPCIFEPKSKVLVDRRSVYQLLSTMKTGKKNNVLKYKVTEKTNATLLPKKRFPMYVDHIHFLTKRTGWKVTKVHSCYTFEQEPFKKEHILGNQRARQEAVVRDDDVQDNLWKLLINAKFGFDCRDNLQNKSLHLIYDEDAEIEFISKYRRYDSNNCFLILEARIKKFEEYYGDLDNLEEDERPYAETLKREEIERVIETYSNTKRGKNRKSKVLSHEGHLEEVYPNKRYPSQNILRQRNPPQARFFRGIFCSVR